MKNAVLILFPLCALAACSAQHSRLQERKHYWEQAISVEVPLGTRLDEVRAWAVKRSLGELQEDQRDSTFGVFLEEVPVNDRVCKGFGLSVHFQVKPDQTVSGEHVLARGNCL